MIEVPDPVKRLKLRVDPYFRGSLRGLCGQLSPTGSKAAQSMPQGEPGKAMSGDVEMARRTATTHAVMRVPDPMRAGLAASMKVAASPAMSVIQPFDRDDLKRQYESAEPFPFLCIDNFLDPEFAKAVSESYPTFESASGRGFSFDYVNERKKVQVTDVSKFPDPVKTLHDAISGQSFLDELAYITGIPNLLSDEKLLGGGMHVTGPHGRLDVHVDFNYVQDRELHRRLNILIYLNPRWDNDWGGEVELWDQDVRRCYQSLRPVINRCVIFRTDESSFHGQRSQMVLDELNE